MADNTDVLLNFYEEDWRQARQAEEQRTSVTNIVLLIASIVIGLVSQTGLGRNVLSLGILLIILGIYGAITSQKLYERQ